MNYYYKNKCKDNISGLFLDSPLILFLFYFFIPHNLYAFGQETEYAHLSLEELMNEKISSATKHPEEAKTIAASVTIIPRSEIEKYGYTTLTELFRNIPGFYMNNNTEDQRVGVRGVIGGGIQFLVNGVPQHPSIVKGLTIPEISRLNIPVEAIDSIEVVRGPMSVIYGNNAFKGSINIITNDIESQSLMISAGYGTQDTSKLFARFGEVLDDGFVSLNVGLYQTNGLAGQYKDMMSSEQLAAMDPAMHNSLDGDVSHDDFNIDFSAAWQNFSANIRYSEMDYGVYIFTPAFGPGNQLELDTFNAMLGYKKQLSNTLTFNSSIIYSHEEYDLPQLDFQYESVQNLDVSQFQETSRTEAELNFIYQPNDKFNLLTGYRYRQVYNSLNDVDLAEFGLDIKRNIDDIVQNDIFFQAAFKPIDSLKLVAGSRWTQSKSFDMDVQDRISNSISTTELHDDAVSFIPSLAAIYSINDHHIIKLLYGEALQDHRATGASEPEEIQTYELNYLAMFKQLYVSMSIFESNSSHLFRNSQRLNEASGAYEHIDNNSGKLETRGSEIIIKYQPMNKLELEFSATWQETTDKINPHIEVGESPEWLAKAKISYQYDNMTYSLLTNYVSSMKSDYVYVDSVTAGEYTRLGEEVDSSILVGVNLRYTHPNSGFYANFHIENLLNEDSYTPANEWINFEKGLLAQERQVMLTLGLEY